jgi:hypothetical protein
MQSRRVALAIVVLMSAAPGWCRPSNPVFLERQNLDNRDGRCSERGYD